MIILAGDVGGTKTILRLTEARSSQTLCEGRYRSQEFSDLSEVVSKFLATATQTLQQSIHPEIACFAIAGPVVNNSSVLTNLGWSLEASRLSQETKIPNISLINDFEAVGYGILELGRTDIYTLQAGELRSYAPIAILGAGTGLGEGFLLHQGGRYRVYASEGGHADFAPQTELEYQLLHYLLGRSTTQHVSVEQIVSGNGILAIYQFLRHHTGLNQLLLSEDEIDLVSKISSAALTAQDLLAEKAMQIFVKAYGAEAGNLALKLLPYGGIYIAGGIAAKILPLMQNGTFLKAFLSKGRMSSLLEKIPVHIVLNPYVGLIGATRYARTMAIESYPHHSNSLIDLS